MKRLICRPWIAVTTLGAAAVLASTFLSVSFGQQRQNMKAGSAQAMDMMGMMGMGMPGVVPNGNRATLQQGIAAEDETRKAIEAYRLTDDEDEKARIVKALPDVVAKQFDARQLAREGELKQLENQLRKLHEIHQLRARQRDQIIEERVRQLLRDADGLGWGSDDELQSSATGYGYGRPGAAAYELQSTAPGAIGYEVSK